MEPSLPYFERAAFDAGGPLCSEEHCPDTLYCLLQCALKNEDLTSGRRLHCLIIFYGLESSSNFANSLIRLFAVCGRATEVHQVFCRIPEKSVYAWSALMIAYIKLGQCGKAISLHCGMQAACVEPDGHTFVALLKACGSISAWTQGRLIHAHVTEMGLEANLFIGNTLVDMYAKAGSMEDSLRVFDGFQCRDITTWNALVSGFFHCGYVSKAFDFFEQLQKENGIEPNIVTWNAVIAGCVHYGLLEAALEYFMRMQQRGFVPDKITWNSLLYGHVQQDCTHETLQLFRQMQNLGMGPDSVTFMCVFKACSSLSSLNYAKFLHSLMIGSSISTSVLVESSLIDMYGRCGDLKTAVKVFSCRLFEKDLVSWNTIIAGHLHHALCQESFRLFEQMLCKGVLPHQVTFVLLLKACSASGYLQEGHMLQGYIMESSFDLDTFVGSALVDFYMKWGNLREARIVFDRIPKRGLVTWSTVVAGYAWHGNVKEALWLMQKMEEDGVKPTVVTWNGLIRGCAYNGLCAEAFYNFNQLLIHLVEPNEATFVSVLSACLELDELKQGKVMHAYLIEGGWESGWSTVCALINMYANAHCLEDSLFIFDVLFKQEIRVWSTMIEAFVQQQHFQEAIQLSQRMQQEGMFLNQVVMASILKACISAKMLFQSKLVHVQALELGFESGKLVGHSLMNIYAKCGSLKDVWSVFYRICNRDEVTWSAMLEACAYRNDHKLALQCFQGLQAENLDPNEVSFLSLLSVCSHTGLTEEACHYFSAMSGTYGIVPSFTHYTCLADVFGRTGRLVEADDLLYSMPFEPNFIGYLSVLNHCKTHGNYHAGEDYFDRTHGMTYQHSACYDFISEIHAPDGSWKGSSSLNELQRCEVLRKKPGGTLLGVDTNLVPCTAAEK